MLGKSYIVDCQSSKNKAGQSQDFSIIRLFFRDIRYCKIKFEFLIFKFSQSALNYFIHAEVGILNLFLIFEESFM